jgi:hypothetical protein
VTTALAATSGYIIKCLSTIRATLRSGTGLPGAGIGTVSSFTFSTCTGSALHNGTLAIKYVNSTHKLQLLAAGGNLHFYKTVGCAGLIRSQDRLTLSAAGTVTPAQTITSP